MKQIYFILLTSSAFLLFRCNLPKELDETKKIVPVPYVSTLEVVNHDCFEIGYDLAHRHAAYVRYVITPDHLQGTATRKNNFKPDPLLPEQFSAQDEDYYKSGFDRGHLCPAADMKVSQTCMDKSFYYSNMSPQLPGFNRGIWKKLEAKVRDWCLEADSLRINTGPIFTEADTTLGSNKIAVPQRYYKTILRYQQNEKQMIGFILKNASSKAELSSFAVNIDKIENLTKLDFYPFLSNNLENELESQVDLTSWFD